MSNPGSPAGPDVDPYEPGYVEGPVPDGVADPSRRSPYEPDVAPPAPEDPDDLPEDRPDERDR